MKYLILLVLLGCTPLLPNRDISCKHTESKIKFISNSCDKQGDCGVLLEDDTYVMYARFPFIGKLPSGPYCKIIE